MNTVTSDTLPYEWSAIVRKFSEIGSSVEHDNVNFAMILRILDQLETLPSWTPNKYAEQFSATESYKGFNTWLLGRLIDIQLRSNLKRLHEKCFHIQVKLLQRLHDNNLVLYQNALGRYILLLKEVCDIVDLGQAEIDQRLLLFNWSSQKFMGCSELELGLHGYLQLTECVNFIFSLFTTLDHELSVVFYVEILSVLLECALKLLLARKKHPQLAEVTVYKFITYLLHDSSSSKLPVFKNILTVLLEQIMVDVSNVCQKGSLSNEEEFCAICNAFVENMTADCFDYSFPETMYSLLLQRSKLVSETAEEAMLKVLSKMFELCNHISIDSFLKDGAWSAQNVNVVVTVLRHHLEDDIRRKCWHGRTSIGYRECVNLYQLNEYWKQLLDLVFNSLSKELELIGKVHIKPKFTTIFKTACVVSQLATRITEELENENIDVVFFGEKITEFLDSLTKLFSADNSDSSKTTLLLFLNFARNVSCLNEALKYDQRIRQQLSTLFTLSWLPETSVNNALPASVRQKYLSSVDDEIREFCVLSLMSCICRYEFADWRDQFFKEIIDRRSVRKLEMLPILVHSLNDDDLKELVNICNSVEDKKFNDDLSSHIRILVCGADREHSRVTRCNEICRVSCNICDNECISNITTSPRCNLFNDLVIHMISISEQALYNVLCATVHLFHHLPKTITLLEALQKGFKSSNVAVYKKIIEITPHLIFRPLDSVENMFLPPATSKFCIDSFKNFMEHLRLVAFRALVNQEIEVQYVCVNTVSQISCNPLSTENTLLPCIDLLLIFMLNAKSAYVSLANSAMRQIAIDHASQADGYEIYMKYREEVCRRVANVLVFNFRTYGITLTNLNRVYADVFNYSTINHILQYLLPDIAKDEKLAVLLPELADRCAKSVPKMLEDAFKHIISHVMLFESKETIKKVINLVIKKTNIQIYDLLSKYLTRVLAQVFMYYDEKQEKVKWVLKEILLVRDSKIEEPMTTQDEPVSDSAVESFLESQFFGVLIRLEKQLSSDKFCERARRRTLSAFKSLILFMSSTYITSVRFKVLLTLRTITALEKDNAPIYCIDIWDTFVHKLDTKVLGPMLSTIFVSLLPFVEAHTVRVNKIYHYLIIEHKESVGNKHILQLYFLPQEHCEDIICTIIEKTRKLLEKKPLEKRLGKLLEASLHEVEEVKLYALRHLKRELAANRSDISRLTLASDSVSRLVFLILDVLVDGFRNSDPNVRLASAECLGEFGAIDPTYVPNVVINENDSKKYVCYDVDAVEFVTQAFTLLCSGLQSTGRSANIGYFALAIQELIKLYQIDFKEENKYWRELPEQVREVIRPLQSTKYIIENEEKETNAQVSHLVFSSSQHSTVQKWAVNWSTFLVSLLPEDMTVGEKDLKLRQILALCRVPMSWDIKCMMLFLPRILLYAILASNDENLVKIYEEMMCVIKHDGSQLLSPNFNDERTCTQVIISEELSVISNTDQEMGVICPKIIFNLLDVLHKKNRDLRAASQGRMLSDRKRLHDFLSKFPKFQLAQKAFDRKEYMRSLLYLEEFLRERDTGETDPFEQDERLLSLLANIYFHLNDVDSVKGIFATHTLKLHQLQNVIKLHEITDQFQDAAICYQQLLRTPVSLDEERAVFYEKRAIQCYLAINQPELALRFVNSLSSAASRQSFYDVECEALWNLSQFDKLGKLTTCPGARNDENWGVRIGQSLVYLLKGEQPSLEREMNRIRTTLTKSLHMSTATMGGYRESYDFAVKLHILTEFEKIAELLFGITSGQLTSNTQLKAKFNTVIRQEFDERLRKLQPTNRVLQQVLNIRQAMFTVASKRLFSCEKEAFVKLFNDEIRRCRLKVIEMANRTRNFELAYSNIIAIDNYQLKGFFIEKAKYYWEKTEQQEALRTLQRGLEFHYPKWEDSPQESCFSDEDRKICAEAFILLGTYNDEVANIDISVNLKNFRAAAKIYSQSENTLFKLAQYQEKVIAADKFAEPDKCAEIMRFYGQSLTYGCEFIYHSLSTMLNIWMDLAEHMNKMKGKQTPRSNDQLQKLKDCVTSMTNELTALVKKLPVYYLLTALPLIVSRLTHPEKLCFNLLQEIIIRCLLMYPNHSLWHLTSLREPRAPTESAKLLSERAKVVLGNEKLEPCKPMIIKFRQLFEEFSKLCRVTKNFPPGPININALIPATSTVLTAGSYDDILIPAQKFITIALPRSATSISSESDKHNPFPEVAVNIARVRNEASVYASLQRPVRVVLIGTDGRSYPMIFKTDDLRIDSRAMEFNAVVNMYLKRDAEARNRALCIRTYSTLPLYGSTGMIEFIPNLDTMRMICNRMRKCLGLTTATTEDRRLELLKTLEEKRKRFRSLCNIYKPTLHEWFAIEFPNPSSWYTARTAYVRSLAVMSVVGYMLGLGDRHNDNILLDCTNGNIVHVDFNSLFNKGETMPCPERVPFRLTHSMIKAMGPLGYEGCFRYTCEMVNRIIRAHKVQLCSVLNTFLYDPSDFTDGRGRKPSSAVLAEKMAEKLRDVDACMSGVVRSLGRPPSMPLSIEGQISRLIEEATSEDNLCQMFSGWASFM